MRGTNVRPHHHPARLGARPAGRFLAAAAAAAGLLASALGWSSPAWGSTTQVALPTEVDALAFAPNAETILFGPLGIETRLPGPVDDAEQVSVTLGPDGSITGVRVAQRLTLSGTGDFSFKVPGPARDVTVLPGSDSAPGVRKGALLWQGFAGGRKLLAAQVDLFPAQEAGRLPVRFTLAMRVEGHPLSATAPASGPFELSLAVENISSVPIGVADARADPSALAPILDAVRGVLAEGRRPRPGEGGLPAGVPVTGSTATRRDLVEVPFSVRGEVVFPPGSLLDVAVDGGTVRTDRQGVHVAFDRQLGGGAPGWFALEVRGRAVGLRLPRLKMTGAPALPRADVLRPPRGRTWTAAVASGSGVNGRAMLRSLLGVLWRVARLRQFDAYLGNPDLHGTSASTYRFTLAPPARQGTVSRAAAPASADLLTLVMAGLVAALVAAGLAVAWSRS
jgi:hypothetical protein